MEEKKNLAPDKMPPMEAGGPPPMDGPPGPPPEGGPFGLQEKVDHLNWPGEAPAEDSFEVSEELSADVVIVGGGNAGLQVALAAAEEGASVIVVEKKTAEKMSWTGEQIGSYNSEFLTKLGFGNYDLDEIIEEYCKCGNYYVNRSLIARYVRKSGEMLDHLLSLVPPTSNMLDPDQCNVHCQLPGTKYPYIRGGYKTWAGTLQFRGSVVTTYGVRYRVNQFSRLPELMGYAYDRTVALGAKWLHGCSAELVTKDGGRATGVIVKDADGRFLRVKANKGVVLSTGSFTDRGKKLGAWAGGHMDNNPVEQVTAMMMGLGSHLFGTCGMLALNNNGVRFYNESVPYGNAAVQQPEGIISYITDANWYEQVKCCSLQHGNPDFGMPAYFEQCAEDLSHVVAAGKEGYEVRNLGLSERETIRIYGAETLPELADILGYEGERKENFLKSIERYNELCEKGYDEDFGKDPDTLLPIRTGPFFADKSLKRPINWKPRFRFAAELSGLHTDNDLCVVDEHCNPIPGLYAAGNCLGYIRSVFYCTPSGGNYIGMACTLGRELGKHLAAL